MIVKLVTPTQGKKVCLRFCVESSEWYQNRLSFSWKYKNQ